MDTKIFRSMSYGVYAVGTMDGERPAGCIANSVMQITSSPATVAVSMNHDNYTNSCMRKHGYFSVSILSESTDPSVIGTLGFSSGKDRDKFADISYEMAEGVPVVKDSCGYIVCRIIKEMETSTHTVFLGEVIGAEVLNEGARAMTYAYYHQVIKGKSPKNAPTYLPEEEKKEAAGEKKLYRFVCQVCGYVYEAESLPADFRCPVCGVGADRFSREE